MSEYRIISSDNHVTEPADLWTSRISSKFKDRAPHLEHGENADSWVCDGHWISGAGGSGKVGARFADPRQLMGGGRIEQNRPGGYIPEEHVKDLDLDGTDIGIIYPTVGVMAYGAEDSDLLTEICSVYNDWIAEFCGAAPSRLKGIAMLNVDDVGMAVKELERGSKIGLIGGMITVQPPFAMIYENQEYDPLWAAAQDLGMPLSLHAGTNRAGFYKNPVNARAAFVTNLDHWVRMALGDIIFSGAFERYPKLQVGSVEHELSWASHFLDRMDYTYTQRTPFPSRIKFRDDAFPSDYFRSNCFVGFQEDALGIRDRHVIGVDTLQWGSDYPHPESTFPRSREILDNLLADCAEEEKANIAGGNTARVYNLD